MTHYDVIDTLVKLYPTIKSEPEFEWDITKLWIYVMNKFAGEELFKQTEEFSGTIKYSSTNQIVINGWELDENYNSAMINITNSMLLLKKIELLQEN